MKQSKQQGGRVKHVSMYQCSAVALKPLVIALAAIGLQPLCASSQETAEESVRTAPVVVTPTRIEQSAFDLPTAVTAIEADTIQEARPAVNISETLVRSPGTVVQNRETFAQEQQIIIRGFGARSSFGTRGVKLLADGIPASTPDGQGGPGLFDLNSAKRIEVLRGPFSALYGNHSGGVVQVFTEDGPERPTLTGSFSAGSYDTNKTGLKFGGQSGDLNYIGSASHFRTDGYRDHSSAQKDQFNSKFTTTLGDRSTLTAVINYLNQPDNEDPLGLTASEVKSNPQQAAPDAETFDTGRDLTNLQTGAVYEQRVTDTDTLRLVGYVGRRGNDGFLAISTTLQNGIRNSGGVSVIDRDFYGIGARWTHQRNLLSGPLTMTFGADYDYAADARRGYVNNNGNQGALKRDEDNTTYSQGGYIQTEWQVTQDWAVSAGLRYTKVSFESEDHFICTTTVNTTGTPLGTCSGSTTPVTVTTFNPDDSGAIDHSAWTPVLGLVRKLTPTVNLYANAGKSFETPTLIELAYQSDPNASGLNFDLQPSTSWHYELGTKVLLGSGTLLEAAIFQIETQNEIVIETNAGGRQTYQNAGDTQRRGVELSMNSEWGRGFSSYFSATYLDAKFEDSFDTCVTTPCPPNALVTVNAGNRIPAIPRYTLFLDLGWRSPAWGFFSGVEGRWQGNVPVNDINSEFADAFFVANLRAGFNQELGGWRLTEFVRVENIFDKQYIGAVLVNANIPTGGEGRFYAPAAGRNALAGLSATYAF